MPLRRRIHLNLSTSENPAGPLISSPVPTLHQREPTKSTSNWFHGVDDFETLDSLIYIALEFEHRPNLLVTNEQSLTR